MRVGLVVVGLEYGGVERWVGALAAGAAEHGSDAVVYALARGGPLQTELEASGTTVRVFGIRSPRSMGGLRTLRDAIRSDRIDLVHSHLASADIVTAAATARLGRPRLSTVHNPGVQIHGLKRLAWRAALLRFQEVSAVSRAAAVATPGVQPTVRPISLADPPPSSGEDRDALRRALGLDPGRPVVLTIARLHPIKGIDRWARLAAGLAPDVQVAVVGDGPLRDAVRKSRLILVGERAQAERYLPAADCYVSPSRSEGFPQVLLQALAHRVPIVATEVGGTAEVVATHGLLVPAHAPEGLIDGVKDVLASPSAARARAEAGLQSLSARRLWRTQTVADHWAWYHRFVGQN